MIGFHEGLEQGSPSNDRISTSREAQGTESFGHFLLIRHHSLV